MTGKPLVALAAAAEQVDGVPHVAVREVYVRALEQVSGCHVVVVGGPAPDLAHLVDRFDGVVFGGHQSNVLPRWYGGEPGSGPADADRDELALSVIPAALRADVPVLGICRGLQELNVALGGTLRNVPGHTEDLSLPRDEQYLPAHPVRLTEGGVLRRLLGEPSVEVNSLHYQAIDRLAPGLRVEAVAPDGVVEAASAEGAAFCLAVQWHPEWYAATDLVSVALFTGFGAAVAARAARRAVI
ncbi:gamma-glutamyl-gamma-aminobutyrate hydrolase family protein [Saccharothrix sp. 6-C]|uniref:gamma-glutamyl-gamma-aminobutyrate hydrolase family protein n=1 Tax=Saccharothrix sp. 6-C TaxID=2781735 RepID=UPI001916F917|nr:gamma-glutamyl-gamma-aminobutyrate hydrolase family protein [Saccharothrix sp. 6-C]QQQ79409.1 gamma-glutamyl-gamma-aminobutyrate hydrolase family protein [Saccharothrix sp. 6-C]